MEWAESEFIQSPISDSVFIFPGDWQLHTYCVVKLDFSDLTGWLVLLQFIELVIFEIAAREQIIEPMVNNTWKVLQPIFRVNQQIYRCFSVIIGKRNKVSGHKHSLDHNSKRLTAEWFQQTKISHHRGYEDSHRNKLDITGKRILVTVTKFV